MNPDRHNNLTALRWFAALAVLYGHSFIFLGLPEPVFMNMAALGALGVYIFFGLSGYLVAQSWRNDPHVLRFILRRCLRIFPGLIVCTLLTIVVMSLMSSLSAKEFFSHSATWGYLSNSLLYVTYYLPGVFEGSRIPNTVNGSLWSLPAEFAMYLLLAIVGLAGARSKWISLIAMLSFIALSVAWASRGTEMIVVYRTHLQQAVIVGSYFWVGVCIFQFNITRFFTLPNIIMLLALWLASSRWHTLYAIGGYITLPCVALAFGLSKTSILTKLDAHDYSYGMYIYAFPVQQSVVKYWPQISLPLYLVVTASITFFLGKL